MVAWIRYTTANTGRSTAGDEVLYVLAMPSLSHSHINPGIGETLRGR